MGEPISAGQRPPGPPRGAGRPIGYYLAFRLALPAVLLVLAWGALAGAVFAGALRGVIGHPGHRAAIEGIIVAGTGLLVALVIILLIWLFARRLAAEARGLAATARYLADEQLPRTMAQLRDASQPRDTAPPGETAPLPPPSAELRITEFADVGAALSRVQGAAITAATAEARLRAGFRQVLTSLGRRNQSLLLRQLRIIDTLEQQAASPAALSDLFTLDHLTTRMRRHAESLTVLSGAPAARPRTGPVPVIDVIRAAVAETEDYKRVAVRTEAEETVTASAVNDLIHLLAELIENATLFSPSSTKVEVRAERVGHGFAIEVEDRGLGIAPDQLAELNQRLASPPDFDLVDADRLGLFVAGLLASRHSVEVSLTHSPYRGTKAIVLLPEELMRPPVQLTVPDGAAAARLRAANALSLVGAGAATALDPPGAGEPETASAEPAGPTTFHGLPRRVRPDRSQPATPANPATPAAAPASSAAPAAAPTPDPETGYPAPGTADAHPAPASYPAPAAYQAPGRLPAEGPAPGKLPAEGPAPDEARRLASALQRSWHRSRAVDDLSEAPGAGREHEEES